VTLAGSVSAVGDDGADRDSPGAVLAFDIGGTKLAVGVVHASGVVHSFVVEPTRAEEGPEPGLERLFGLGRRALAHAGHP
jgi:glucokinase